MSERESAGSAEFTIRLEELLAKVETAPLTIKRAEEVISTINDTKTIQIVRECVNLEKRHAVNWVDSYWVLSLMWFGVPAELINEIWKVRDQQQEDHKDSGNDRLNLEDL